MAPYPIPFLNLEYVYYSIIKIIFGDFDGDPFIVVYDRVSYFAEWLVPYALFISIFLLVVIVYCLIRIHQIERDLLAEKTTVSRAASSSEKKINTRWERIITHLNSDSENDWRLAILEADVILEEMLTSMGYYGETIGEQLQSIERSDFQTLDDAWEAHKVRNRIAHEGSGFALTKREAKRIISLYEKVFNEFKFV